MSAPQHPEQRGSGKSGATPQPAVERTAREAQAKGGQPHGTDKGDRGGGEGGSVPPEHP
ncbi:hypothetical protein [Streptomyces sp. NPDC047009]|uniref:hypothetical protein n=1 Tax=Streptomyces sp. NPDC047009 TaxID=3154496 RepID=UPI0033D3E650